MTEPEKPTEYLARKGEGTMDREEFEAVVKTALAESVSYVDAELSEDRAKASDYYNGKPFGNEEEGRSQAILTEVRDAVDGMLPSALRVFFGAEHSVEFVPTNKDNVEQAAQKTDYVRYVFEQDNSGFLRAYDVLKDGLIRKLGIFKWGWDDSVDTKAYRQEGVTPEQLQLLAADDAVTFPEGGVVQRADGNFDVDLTRTEKAGRAWVEALPPEEFIFNREARRLDKALLVAHRTEKTRGELLAMGVKAKEIDEHGGPGEGDTALRHNAEELARKDMAAISDDPEMGKANDKIAYTEAYLTVDYDGDGIAELRKICTIGPSYYPVSNEPTAERPFAIFTPHPEPHALIGGSTADRTMDVQKINSALLRGMLDSLSASIFPRTVYQEGQASVADIMNTAIGAPIRERISGVVRPLVMPFTGKEAMPILQFMQEVIERRTGRNKGAAGLDADALQSTGKEAVGAVLTGSQEQIELICRIFAEQTLKPLFKGLGRLLTAKQPRSRVVKLRGTWVEVDPRTWQDDMDVTVNVGLGTTFVEKKIATLMAVAADQKDILTNMGISNPLVTLPMFRNTRAKILALQGIKDADSYYAPLPPDWQPPPPPPTPPDPEIAWMQLEKEMNHTKTMKELAIKEDELKLAREKMATDAAQKDADRAQQAQDAARELEFKMEELVINTALERAKLEATIDAAGADEEVDRQQQESSAATQKAFSDINNAITALATKETPAPVFHVAAPDLSGIQPPVVNVHPSPAPTVHVSTPEPKGRKSRIKKTKDGYEMESDS
jgi:hypothetical protein